MNSRELPTDHLATTTKEGHRVYLYPADVRGRFRNLRNVLNVGLIAFFLTLPWIKIGGRPAILLNLPERKFAVLGIQFWAHDAPMLFLVIASLVLAIAFVTAVWGRVWCGYACPQTVFVDGVFRKIERWIEGDSIQRKALDQAPWTQDKIFKKSAKWLAFLAVSLVIGHSFLAYFTGTEALAEMMGKSPLESPGTFGVMAFISGLVLFDFGWFREQFCIVACPYGRFQSVLMDDRSMVVAYDPERGEPRRGVQKIDGKTGDCVNCYRCVAVCPTGVDIRRGTQLECIACTACMDACDQVMEKIKKPKGLIRYKPLVGELSSVTPLRPRSVIYAVILSFVGGALTWKVSQHETLSVEFVRAIETPYQILKDESKGEKILNHFKLDLRNQDFDAVTVAISIHDESRQAGFEMITIQPKVTLAPGELKRLDVFFKFPKEQLKNGTSRVRTLIHAKETLQSEVHLVGPLF
jgi:cytochrome c oxidase accessory protein FixG